MRYLCAVPFFSAFYILYVIFINFVLLRSKERIIEYDATYDLLIEPRSCKPKTRDKLVLFYTPLSEGKRWHYSTLPFYYLTDSDDKDRRTLLRHTAFNEEYYSKLNVEHVFVIGSSGSGESNGQLEFENVTHRDIIQSTVLEDYRTLTMKNLVVWEWIEDNCYHADYVVKLDSDVLVNPFIFEDYIMSITDGETTQSLRGFIYPERLRQVHRSPLSKFYLSRETYNSGVYPIYPAGGAYMASTPMIYLLLKLMRQYEMYSFPFEDVVNGILLEKENMGHLITHARSFNLDGIVDRSDPCNIDYFSVFNLCPSSNDENNDCSKLIETYYSYFEQITSSTHYNECEEMMTSPSAQCFHQSFCQE